jgi:hypothetical protein
MPSTDTKPELTAKASMAQPVSQPAVYANGLTGQEFAFCGHGGSSTALNRGNFTKFLNVLKSHGPPFENRLDSAAGIQLHIDWGFVCLFVCLMQFAVLKFECCKTLY